MLYLLIPLTASPFPKIVLWGFIACKLDMFYLVLYNIFVPDSYAFFLNVRKVRTCTQRMLGRVAGNARLG